GLDVSLALRRVRDQVLASTGGKQAPFVYGSLGGAEILLARKVTAEPAASPQAGEAERVWFGGVKDTISIAVLDDFVRRYPDTIFATMARERREELKKIQ